MTPSPACENGPPRYKNFTPRLGVYRITHLSSGCTCWAEVRIWKAQHRHPGFSCSPWW
ncbi:hypothetical protein SAMN00790413_05687 [Deinococcus hopiensis KR-140]|uniref:Uncharacterized protein n=1 Tax=Deinococcus hopiensis KR-140 TaxID=695939 RepID=A0A1W1UCY0_9DEIO|nr:hypothetical protein SAMN00790413_05687 [Deinococcus hopiensis KR-140]